MTVLVTSICFGLSRTLLRTQHYSDRIPKIIFGEREKKVSKGSFPVELSTGSIEEGEPMISDQNIS